MPNILPQRSIARNRTNHHFGSDGSYLREANHSCLVVTLAAMSDRCFCLLCHLGDKVILAITWPMYLRCRYISPHLACEADKAKESITNAFYDYGYLCPLSAVQYAGSSVYLLFQYWKWTGCLLIAAIQARSLVSCNPRNYNYFICYLLARQLTFCFKYITKSIRVSLYNS
jgi:hypothetical protein